jgi:hypothetical protein
MLTRDRKIRDAAAWDQFEGPWFAINDKWDELLGHPAWVTEQG